MNEFNVRIVRLEPLRAACVNGFGVSPEGEAWSKLWQWAEGKGLLANYETRRYFGYNNPNPTPGSPNYGYDQWMTVEPEVKSEAEVKVFDFPGGLYAVTRTRLDKIGENWMRLVAWVEASPYQGLHAICLEECLTPKAARDGDMEAMELDLYLPVAG